MKNIYKPIADVLKKQSQLWVQVDDAETWVYIIDGHCIVRVTPQQYALWFQPVSPRFPILRPGECWKSTGKGAPERVQPMNVTQLLHCETPNRVSDIGLMAQYPGGVLHILSTGVQMITLADQYYTVLHCIINVNPDAQARGDSWRNPISAGFDTDGPACMVLPVNPFDSLDQYARLPVLDHLEVAVEAARQTMEARQNGR